MGYRKMFPLVKQAVAHVLGDVARLRYVASRATRAVRSTTRGRPGSNIGAMVQVNDLADRTLHGMADGEELVLGTKRMCAVPDPVRGRVLTGDGGAPSIGVRLRGAPCVRTAMHHWIVVGLFLAACGGTSKPVPKPQPPMKIPTTDPIKKTACGCTSEACRDKDFSAYFEAAFCTWHEQTCACTDRACAEQALGPINDFKRSLAGTTMTLPPADVIERASKHTDEANACLAKLGAAD
jgi:hypothetical protein